MMGIKASCDACGHIFEIEKLQTRIIRDDLKVHYFTCPSCKCEYKTHYTNKTIEKQQDVVRRARAAMNNSKLSDEKLKDKNMTLQIEQAKLKNLMHELAIEIEKNKF